MRHDTQAAEPRARALYVPVRAGTEWLSVRTFRTPTGEATAVAFTSQARLGDVLGERQASTRLSEKALRQLMFLQGITRLTVDPALSSAAVGPDFAPPGRWDIRRLDGAGVTGPVPVAAHRSVA